MEDVPDTLEVAVAEDRIVINYRCQPGPDGWGHLSFTVAEAEAFITALQGARDIVKGWTVAAKH